MYLLVCCFAEVVLTFHVHPQSILSPNFSAHDVLYLVDQSPESNVRGGQLQGLLKSFRAIIRWHILIDLLWDIRRGQLGYRAAPQAR